ncbi:MAG: 23S rRNA (uracil(1939)-C(5))-methyltransferase RlmD, partial [Heliobacteriaceae bacterium]|nr:23S rRNA (uracil(1939)-C(5))-methyltransferase RlmD [Heliobacteriaceae bacterium]
MMQVGDTGVFLIERLTLQGEGVARQEGLVLFVPGCLPGERVRVRITARKPRFARGELLAVEQPAPERVTPRCPVFGLCGGCQLQMLAYPDQLKLKRQAVQDALRRIGGVPDVPVAPVWAAPAPWRYRNRVQFHVDWPPEGEGPLRLGYFRQNTRELVEYDGCPLLPPSFAPVFAAVRRWLPVVDPGRELAVKHLVLKATGCGRQLMLILVVAKWQARLRSLTARLAGHLQAEVLGLVSVLINVNKKRTGEVLGPGYPFSAGRPALMEQGPGGIKLQLGPASFLQVNPEQTVNLYRLVAEACRLTGRETVVDAYCGVGGISLYLAGQAARVVGIEVVAAAVADARENARLNGITNAAFLAGRVETVLPAWLPANGPVDVVVLDPPRHGCQPAVLA